jgi:serine/threonine-protein kinase
VIHRDIKPENVMLSRGHAVVADFGIARAVSVAGGEQLTETGMAVGTPVYMSPEQATADEVDGRSDIYSLACVLYEMVGGDPPYTGSTPKSVLARKLTDPVPSLRALRRVVSSELEAVVVKALEREPVDRYQTAELFADALSGAGEAEHVGALAEGKTRFKPRHIVYVVGSLAALLVLWWGGSVLRRGDSNAGTATESIAFGLNRLAVLPFQNLTGDTAREYLIDGIMEELTSGLAKAATLEVRSRTSAIRYKGTQLSTPEIGRELGVDGLVEGSVLGWGDTVRVVVQLVDAERDAHRWSREYTEPYEQLPSMSGQITRDLLVALGVTGLENVRSRGPPTENIVAYELYQQGRRALFEPNPNSPAYELFTGAIAEDSGFAEAWAGLADAYALLPLTGANLGMRSRELVRLARQAVLRALQLDPELSEARTTRGIILEAYDYQYEEAEREFNLALELKPGNALAHSNFAYLLAFQGRQEEALAHAREGQRLRPTDPMMTTDLAFVLILTRRCDSALEEARRAMRMAPDHSNAAWTAAAAQICLGSHQEAIETLESLIDSDIKEFTRYLLGYEYAKVGRRDDAERVLRDIETLGGTPRHKAWVLLGLGRYDQAIEEFRKAIEEMDGLANQDLRLFIWDDYLFDPQYRELLRLVRLEEYVR